MRITDPRERGIRMSVNSVVPFLAVNDIIESTSFYIQGIGFEYLHKWKDEGVLRWCQLKLGNAEIMLQQFAIEGPDSRQFEGMKGEGVTLCFFCDDAVELYRELRSRGIEATEPVVGNGLWVTEITDPDEYNLIFESPTEVAEDTKMSDLK